jgi:hypothetical protein
MKHLMIPVQAASIDRGRFPPLHWLPLEGRLLGELALLASGWSLLARAPRGDGHPVLVLPGFLATDRSTAPSVPTTSVFDRHDGVVGWRTSLEPPAAQVQNIQSSHFGFGVNPLVWWLRADRLRQPEDNWQPIVAPRALRTLYRTHA